MVATDAAEIELTFNGKQVTGEVGMVTLSAADLDAANPPWDPTAISPKVSRASAPFSVPGNSFTIFTVPNSVV